MAHQDYIIKVQGKETPQDEVTQAKTELIMKLWGPARATRYNFELQWQESALLLLPEWANTFFYGYDQWPGQKKTQQQVDSTGMVALERFQAIVASIISPFTQVWHKVGPMNRDLLKSRRVRDYFARLNEILWNERYASFTNFESQNNQNYQSLGLFGNMHMYVDEAKEMKGVRGLRYKSVSPGCIYPLDNHQGLMDSYFNAFRWTARQIWQEWPDTFPAALATALEQGSQQKYWVVQYVYPRKDTEWQPWRVDAQGKAYGSCYVSMTGKVLLSDGGYRCFPLPTGRYTQAPDEVVGRGPAQKVLPSLKTLNAQKTDELKLSHRAADPIYLTYDDTLNFKSHPGAWNPGMLNKDGKRLVDVLPYGNYEISKESRAEEQALIKDEFLVTLFQMAWDAKTSGQMSARQVIEFLHDRALLMAPTIGRQYSEYQGPLIHRELDVLAWEGKLPDLPPELKEDGQGYKTEYTSPLAQALRSGKTAGFMRMVEVVGNIAQQTGDPTAARIITLGLSRSLPAIAEEQGVDETWLATVQEMKAAADGDAKAQAESNRIKALPAEAAMAKAQAITAKAQTGGNTGGTLSGTPPTGMPQIPGNPQGTPGQPGINGGPGQPGQPPQQ